MVMARHERDRDKERFWRQVLRQWRRSGQGIRSFCFERGLSESLFYAWRRTIQERDRQPARSSRRATEQPASTGLHRFPGDGLPALVPVTVAAAAPALEVALADGRVVRVPAGFDADTLRQLLAILAEAPPC
jgi:transposase-like protein